MINSLNNRYSRVQTLQQIDFLTETNKELQDTLKEIYSIVGGYSEPGHTLIDTINLWKASHARVETLEAELEALRQTT